MRKRLRPTVANLAFVSGMVPGAAVMKVEKRPDGIRFDVNVGVLGLQAIDDHIIRVKASPVDMPSARRSLIIEEKDREPVTWTVQESDDAVTLATGQPSYLGALDE